MEQPVIDAVQTKDDLGHGTGKVHRVAKPPTGDGNRRRTFTAVCGAKVSKALVETLPHPDDLCAKCWSAAEREPYGFAAAYEFGVHTPLGLEGGRFGTASMADQYAMQHPMFTGEDVTVVGHVPKTDAWVNRDGNVIVRE